MLFSFSFFAFCLKKGFYLEQIIMVDSWMDPGRFHVLQTGKSEATKIYTYPSVSMG